MDFTQGLAVDVVVKNNVGSNVLHSLVQRVTCKACHIDIKMSIIAVSAKH